MNKALSVLALILVTVAVVIMLLPTYASAFGADDGTRVTMRHPWYDLFLLVYFDVVPALALFCALAMMVGLIFGLARATTMVWTAVPGYIAATLLLLLGYNLDASGFVTGLGVLVAPLLASASILITVAWSINRGPGSRARSAAGDRGDA